MCIFVQRTTKKLEPEHMKHCFLTLLAGLFILQLTAQSSPSIQGFVLYKGYPYLVNMTPQGDILEFLQTAPEIMFVGSEYPSEPPMPLGPYVRPKAVALEEYNSPLNSSNVSDIVVLDIPTNKNQNESNQNSNDLGVKDDTEIKPKVDQEMKTTVIRRTNEEGVTPIIERSTEGGREVEEGSYNLKFQGFTSRLTPTLINQLKDIYKVFQSDPNQQITIRSFVTSGDNTNLRLAENRMAACRDLLGTYGVPLDKMETKVEPYRSANSGQINISLE